jgi:hypothetical protein
VSPSDVVATEGGPGMERAADIFPMRDKIYGKDRRMSRQPFCHSDRTDSPRADVVVSHSSDSQPRISLQKQSSWPIFG